MSKILKSINIILNGLLEDLGIISDLTYLVQNRTKLKYISYILLFYSSLLSAEKTYPVNDIPVQLLANANAVVREDITRVKIHGQKNMEVYNRNTITILNKEGKKYGNVILNYDQSREISNLRITLYDADGIKINTVPDAKIDDVNASSNNAIYDDTRAKVYIPRINTYPYTISYSYKTKTKNTLLIPSWYPVNNYYVSVELSKFELTCPKEHRIITKEKNLDNFDVTVRRNSFQAKNIPCFRKEEYGPMPIDLFPYIMLSPEQFYYEGINGKFSNWNEYGTWVYNELLKNKDTLSERIQLEVSSLVNESDTPYNKAKKIYQYVQQNTDYIQIKYGIGGVMPLAAERVHALKYGDCKALTNYTQALLKLVGIESRYTEVYGSKEIKKDYESDFASISQGNHIILCIPQEKDTIWVDCTSDKLPFGFVGSFTDDRKALLISEEGGKIVSTPKYTYRDNVMTELSKILINEDGSTQIFMNLKNQGMYFFDKISHEYMSQNETKAVVKNYFKDEFSRDAIDEVVIKTSTDKATLSEQIKFTSKALATSSDRYIILPFQIMKPVMETPPVYEDRTQNIVINRGYTNQSKTMYNYPLGYTLENKPPTQAITSPFGKYEISTQFGGQNALVVTTKIIINEGEYDKSSYADFRKFIDKINQIERSKIVLKKR